MSVSIKYQMQRSHCRPISLIMMTVVFVTLVFFMSLSLVAQQKHALLVGISDYPQYKNTNATWGKIHGTNDVHIISPLLKKQGFKVNELTEETATHEGIIKAFGILENEVQPGDLIYIHLSGHGQAVKDLNGDEDDGWDEAFIPFDAERCYTENVYHGENHLLDDELNMLLNAIRSKVGEMGFVYVVMDACHAGSSYRGEEDDDIVFVRGTDIGFSKNGESYTPKIDRRGNFSIVSTEGMAPIYMLEACRSYEINTEIKQNDKYYGPLSYYISQQLINKTLSVDTKWIDCVQNNMDKDIRLVRQHMVKESSR